MDFTTIQFIGSSFVAAIIGFMTGVFGVGGGFLMTPMLIIILNIDSHIAVGTDLVIIMFNSSVGMFKRLGTDTIDVKLAAWLAVGGVVGSQIGLLAMHHIKKTATISIFGKQHDPLTLILLILFLVLLSSIAIFMTYDLKKSGSKAPAVRTGLFAKIKIEPYINFPSLESPKLSLLPILLLGLSTGVLTALMGVGGGVVMLPALIYLVGQRAARAAGTSLFFVLIISLISSTSHFVQGNIKLSILPGMIVGGFIGTWFGTNIGLKLKGPKIRKYFIYIIIAAIIMVMIKLTNMFTSQ